MPSRLAEAHIVAQERLRTITGRGVDAIWRSLPAYNDENVDEWLTRVVPLILAAQRQSVSLTDAFLAQAVGRAPFGPDPARIAADAVRPGVAAEEVYRRPFVTVWTALKAGTAYEDAVAAGRARAVSTAATDVQLAMRETLREVGQEDDRIVGYQRVADAGACDFCLAVNGAKLSVADPMPLHNGCGCGVDVLTSPFAPSRPPGAVAVRDHGELGPVLGDPSHDFTTEADL